MQSFTVGYKALQSDAMSHNRMQSLIVGGGAKSYRRMQSLIVGCKYHSRMQVILSDAKSYYQMQSLTVGYKVL